MDWNWFFSTLAQSSAAIAGFLGAFLIGAIINRENEHDNIEQEMQNLLSSVKMQISSLKILHIESYNAKQREFTRKTYEFYKLVLNEPSKLDHKEIRKRLSMLEYSPYDDRKDLIEHVEKYLGANKGSYIPSMTITEDTIENLNEKRRRIDEEMIRIVSLSDRVRHLLSRTKAFPKGKTAINLILALNILIFLLCVIVPILLLPAVNASEKADWSNVLRYLSRIDLDAKGMITLVFSLVFLTAQIFFLVKNNSQSYNKGIIDELKNYTDIKNYSVYLAHYAENVILNAAANAD